MKIRSCKRIFLPVFTEERWEKCLLYLTFSSSRKEENAARQEKKERYFLISLRGKNIATLLWKGQDEKEKT